MIDEIWPQFQDKFRGGTSTGEGRTCRRVPPTTGEKGNLEGFQNFRNMAGSVSHTQNIIKQGATKL